MLQFDIITIFPKIFDSYFNESILKRAQKTLIRPLGPFRTGQGPDRSRKGLIKIKIHNLRDFTTGRHRSVDDRPYGGGPGMVMRADVIYRALESITRQNVLVRRSLNKGEKIILLSADGKRFDQKMAYNFSK
ncbi:MAG: hypothetical protein NTY61_03125 [Candidatus Parcubacteria bacterium]|nr:hypothetical protein [Candidatus Parcubacteria bacterium]